MSEATTSAGVRGAAADRPAVDAVDAGTDDLDQVPVAAPAERPAAPSSPLAGIRARRAAARAGMHLDVNVPGLDGAFVRFRAITPQESTRLAAAQEKAPAQEKGLRLNAAVLALTCLGVYDTGDDGQPVSIDAEHPDDPAPRFDRRLAAVIEMPFEDDTRAADVVREFYLEPMHVLAVGDEVATWSTARDQELRRSEQGD